MLNEAEVLKIQIGNGYIIKSETHYMPLVKSRDGWTVMDFNSGIGKWEIYWQILSNSKECIRCRKVGRGIFIGKNAKALKWLWKANKAGGRKYENGFLNVFGLKVRR